MSFPVVRLAEFVADQTRVLPSFEVQAVCSGQGEPRCIESDDPVKRFNDLNPDTQEDIESIGNHSILQSRSIHSNEDGGENTQVWQGDNQLLPAGGQRQPEAHPV